MLVYDAFVSTWSDKKPRTQRSRYAHDIFSVVNYTITHELYLVY